MKDKIKNIAEKLEHQIRMHELDLNDRIKDIPQIILLLEQGFSELKEIVSFYKFKSEMDEIFFFKIIKPKFFSKLIYYRKVYNIEMMRPNGQDCVLKNYFINELNQLENFYNKNIDFYKYYRSGSTHLDKYFFLRGKLNRASCGPRGHMKPGVVLSAFNIMGILPCFDRLYS